MLPSVTVVLSRSGGTVPPTVTVPRGAAAGRRLWVVYDTNPGPLLDPQLLRPARRAGPRSHLQTGRPVHAGGPRHAADVSLLPGPVLRAGDVGGPLPHLYLFSR